MLKLFLKIDLLHSNQPGYFATWASVIKSIWIKNPGFGVRGSGLGGFSASVSVSASISGLGVRGSWLGIASNRFLSTRITVVL